MVELFPVRDAIFDNLFCGGGNHSLYMEENMKNMLSTGWDLKSHACGKNITPKHFFALKNWGDVAVWNEPWSCTNGGFFKRVHRWNQGLGIATLWYFCQHRSGPGWVCISFNVVFFGSLTLDLLHGLSFRSLSGGIKMMELFQLFDLWHDVVIRNISRWLNTKSVGWWVSNLYDWDMVGNHQTSIKRWLFRVPGIFKHIIHKPEV